MVHYGNTIFFISSTISAEQNSACEKKISEQKRRFSFYEPRMYLELNISFFFLVLLVRFIIPCSPHLPSIHPPPSPSVILTWYFTHEYTCIYFWWIVTLDEVFKNGVYLSLYESAQIRTNKKHTFFFSCVCVCGAKQIEKLHPEKCVCVHLFFCHPYASN